MTHQRHTIKTHMSEVVVSSADITFMLFCFFLLCSIPYLYAVAILDLLILFGFGSVMTFEE